MWLTPWTAKCVWADEDWSGVVGWERSMGKVTVLCMPIDGVALVDPRTLVFPAQE